MLLHVRVVKRDQNIVYMGIKLLFYALSVRNKRKAYVIEEF